MKIQTMDSQNSSIPHSSSKDVSFRDKMDFEDILSDVGGFGLYQKLLVGFFLIPSFIVVSWTSMSTVFIASAPDHWCHVPELGASNLTLEMTKYLIRPQNNPSCYRYDVNYSEILENRNFTVNPDGPIKKCDHGWDYDGTDFDATSVTNWNMVCDNSHYASLVLSLVFIGNGIGTPLFGYLSDKWGRKTTFFTLIVLTGLSDIGSVLSPYFSTFLFLRAINGSVFSTLYITGFIIVIELVCPEMRARINMIATTAWTAGLCILPLVAFLTRNWIYQSIVTSSSAAFILLYWRLVPESPSWLISQNRLEEAAETMAKIGKVNNKNGDKGDQILRKIQKFWEKKKQQQNGESNSPKDFFKYPTLRKRFILVTLCWIGNGIPYFGLQMNVKNLAGSEFLNFFLVSVVEVPAHLLTWFFTDRVGRRWCAVSAFALSTVSCLIPVILSETEYPGVGVIASLLAKLGTSSTFMTLYQQGSELYPTSLRGVGMGMSCTIGTGLALMAPYIIYMAKYGIYIPFLVFSMLTFTSGVGACFLPETLHKILPQTVDDAENFAKNDNFFTWRKKTIDECSPSTKKDLWIPKTLSALNLQTTTQNK